MHIPFTNNAVRYTTMNTTDDPDEVKGMLSDGNRETLSHLKRYSTTFAQGYTILSLVALSIFVTTMLFRSVSPDALDMHRNSALGSDGVVPVYGQYGRDERYMSLDHKHDHLWSRWGEKANILVPDELNDGKKIPASISMYHQMHCKSCYATLLLISSSCPSR